MQQVMRASDTSDVYHKLAHGMHAAHRGITIDNFSHDFDTGISLGDEILSQAVYDPPRDGIERY